MIQNICVPVPVLLCTGKRLARGDNGRLRVLKSLLPYSSTHLLQTRQTCNRDSPCHLQQHPLDRLIKTISPIHLTQTEGRQEFWSLSDPAGLKPATWCQTNPLAAHNRGTTGLTLHQVT